MHRSACIRAPGSKNKAAAVAFATQNDTSRQAGPGKFAADSSRLNALNGRNSRFVARSVAAAMESDFPAREWTSIKNSQISRDE